MKFMFVLKITKSNENILWFNCLWISLLLADKTTKMLFCLQKDSNEIFFAFPHFSFISK